MGITLDKVLHTERWAPLTELRVVLEDGHKHAGDVERFYNSVRRQYDGESGALAPLRFANKDCLPIASADCWERDQGRDRREANWRPQTSDQGRRLLPRQSLAGPHRARAAARPIQPGCGQHRRPGHIGGRGRDGDYSPPPAQIPACAANAPGSHLGW
jgi:hypothetical protein